MAKKKNHHKMNPARKWAKAIVSLVGTGLATLIGLGPAIQAFQQKGATAEFPRQVAFNYTGFDLAGGGQTEPNFQQTLAGIGSIVGGIVVKKLFSVLARSV